MTHKKTDNSPYRAYFERESEAMVSTIPIFLHPFWLDAVYGTDQWHALFIVNDSMEIQAVTTYAIQQRWGIRRVLMGALTPFAGVWIKTASFEKTHKQNTHLKQMITKLIEQLPDKKIHFWSQKLHFSLTDWQPFYWAGFEQTTHYTYILSNLSDPKRLWENMNDNTKRNIQKAAKQGITIEQSEDFDTFYHLTTATYERQKIEVNLVPYNVFKTLNTALQAHGVAQIYLARDTKDVVVAGIYVVLDCPTGQAGNITSTTAYYLAGGATAEGRNTGAWYALIWQAIQDANVKNCQTFDFEGSMLPTVEPVFRAFGATQMPYFRIRKYKNRFWATVGLWLGWR